MNATFTVAHINYMWPSEAFEQGIDITHDLWKIEAKQRVFVYPVVFARILLILPEALPYPEFSAYLRNALSSDFITYSSISIATVIFLLSLFRYIKRKKSLLLKSTLDVLNLLMNDNGHIKYQELYRAEGVIIVPLTFVGLIVTTGVLSNLKSYLTRPILQPQFTTLEDVYKAPFFVYTPDKTWKEDVVRELTKQSSDYDWSSKVISLEGELDLLDFCESFNLTMSFLLNEDAINLLLTIQKRLNIKGYHKTQHIDFYDIYTYPVNEKFLYFERFNEIIHQIQSAGLHDLWLKHSLYEMEQRILRKNRKRLASLKETYIQNFEFPVYIVYGWLVGVIVLILEVIWKKIDKNFRKVTMTMIEN